jgi:hypothetical protein
MPNRLCDLERKHKIRQRHIEALKRYRTGGEQKLTVQNVSVNDGGQAIVCNVTQAPREACEAGLRRHRPHSLTLSARRWRC